MRDYFHRLRTFDDWANGEIARALAADGAPNEGTRLLAHIVGAEWLWLQRLGAGGRALEVWPALSLVECAAELPLLSAEWERFLGAGNRSWAERISYVNSKGESWTSEVRDVLTHVFAHGVHHRAQIVTLFRQAGMTPPYVDFIEAARRGHLDRASEV